MRWLLCAVLALTFSAKVVRAQEQPQADELKRLGEQLKAAQDRINKLADENEKLITRNTALQKQIDTFAEKTYHLRATHAAWERFLSRYPALAGKWQAFLQTGLLDPTADLQWMTAE